MGRCIIKMISVFLAIPKKLRVSININIKIIVSGVKGMNFRVGHGYDVHRYAAGRKLILGGVDIPFGKGLVGHSDADVVVHAIMDSLLGAAAMGDIGAHFPDSDEQYSGADSLKLLEKVTERIRMNGYEISNVDATIVAQAPKLRPYINTMRKNIAAAMKTDTSAVSVKATTEERLGFTGHLEGVAAHSVALIYKGHL